MELALLVELAAVGVAVGLRHVAVEAQVAVAVAAQQPAVATVHVAVAVAAQVAVAQMVHVAVAVAAQVAVATLHVAVAVAVAQLAAKRPAAAKLMLTKLLRSVGVAAPQPGGGSSVHVSRGVVCTRLPRGRLYTSTCFQVQ